MRPPEAILIDLDGTLYSGSRPLPYAREWLAYLNRRSIRRLFVTNNSSRTPEQVAEQLGGMGIPAEPADVCTSALAAADYAKRLESGGSIFCIGEEGLQEALQSAGFKLAGDSHEAVLAVVQGIDRTFDYPRLAAAVRYIRQGAAYILTNPDRLLPWNGGLTPGAGAIAAAIEAAAGISPVVIGKPSAVLMNYALNRLGLSSDQVWVVGDNLATDIAAGLASGCSSVLVLTGVSAAGNWEEEARRLGIRPDHAAENLDELQRWMDRHWA